MFQERQRLLGRVTAMIERGDSLSVDLPVDTGHFFVDPEVVRRLLALLEEVAELLSDISAYFESEEGINGTDVMTSAGDEMSFLREIGAGISSALAAREVADLALMGRTDLFGIRRQLTGAVESDNFWKIASATDAALSRTGRALIPIESAIRESEELPPLRRRWEDLEDSLEIRRQYAMLWRAVLRAGQPRGEQLRRALRKIGQRIAVLRHHHIYPFLRIEDRLAIRELQKRLHAHLGPAGAESGETLWTEVVTFFRLLMRVNERQELREHDREIVLASYHELAQRRTPGEKLPRELEERLDFLLGRDNDLDRLLLDPAEHRIGDFLEPLRRLSQALLKDSPTAISMPMQGSGSRAVFKLPALGKL